MENINIKTKQKEVLDSTRKLWKETCRDVVFSKTPEWIKTYWTDIFKSISTKSQEMSKIYKRKKMDDDVKLINLLDLKVKIVNEINEINKKEIEDKTTFGEFFDKHFVKMRKCYDNEECLKFIVVKEYKQQIIDLFKNHTTIDINNPNVFYTQDSEESVYFVINRKNHWLESYLCNILNTLYINNQLEWIY